MPQLRELGTSGLKTPKLVLGGNVFGWNCNPPVAFELLEAFLAKGGTMIDTADVYSAWIPGHSGGESETLLGQWLKQRGKRDDVLIATKVGMLPGDGGEGLAPARIAAAVEASLNRLQTNYIDLYYAHRDDPSVPQDEVADAFAQLVSQGKVRALGASNFSAERLASALKTSADRNLPGYTVLQPELNLVKKSGFAGDLQALCVEKRVGVLPYFALASGFLTGKYRTKSDLGKSPRGGRMGDLLGPQGQGVLTAMDNVASKTGATLAQIALAWNAAQPGVTAPIASATTLSQLNELMGALDLDLNAAQLAELNNAAFG